MVTFPPMPKLVSRSPADASTLKGNNAEIKTIRARATGARAAAVAVKGRLLKVDSRIFLMTPQMTLREQFPSRIYPKACRFAIAT